MGKANFSSLQTLFQFNLLHLIINTAKLTKYAEIIIPGGDENQFGTEVLLPIIEKHLLKSK